MADAASPTTLPCEDSIAKQHEADAHAAAHGDENIKKYNPKGGSHHRNKTSSSPRNSPNTMFQMLGLLARSVRGERPIPSATQLIKTEEKSHAWDDIFSILDQLASHPEEDTVSVETPSTHDEVVQVGTSPAKPHTPEECLAALDKWDEILGEQHVKELKMMGLRGDVKALEQALGELSEKVKELRGMEVPPGFSTTSVSIFEEPLEFGRYTWGFAGQLLEWRGRFEIIRIFWGYLTL